MSLLHIPKEEAIKRFGLYWHVYDDGFDSGRREYHDLYITEHLGKKPEDAPSCFEDEGERNRYVSNIGRAPDESVEYFKRPLPDMIQLIEPLDIEAQIFVVSTDAEGKVSALSDRIAVREPCRLDIAGYNRENSIKQIASTSPNMGMEYTTQAGYVFSSADQKPGTALKTKLKTEGAPEVLIFTNSQDAHAHIRKIQENMAASLNAAMETVVTDAPEPPGQG